MIDVWLQNHLVSDKNNLQHRKSIMRKKTLQGTINNIS